MTSKLQLVQGAQLQMSRREQSRSKFSFDQMSHLDREDKNQTQSEHFDSVLSNENKK